MPLLETLLAGEATVVKELLGVCWKRYSLRQYSTE